MFLKYKCPPPHNTEVSNQENFFFKHQNKKKSVKYLWTFALQNMNFYKDWKKVNLKMN